ncbi:MAG TPA: transporter substrate-binding domain-containing protein [Xanthobacteraceae bacterium]|nr:transporter substrate-binding domain-containing protein [Xanthobacteraceae bacterium]
MSQSIDPRIADLVQAGKIRVALYVPQYTKDPATGALRGWTIDLVAALGERLGIAGVPVEHPTPPDAVRSVVAGTCDTSILGIEKVRAAEVDYTPGLIEADYSLLVPAGSSIGSVADADRPGIQIAVVRHHASTLTLERMLKHATLVYADLPDPTFEIMRSGKADVMASLHEILLRYSGELPGSRVLEQRYGFNTLALAVRKGQSQRLACLTEFVEEAKASGVVRRAIDRSGWHGLHVAPPA